MDQQITKQSKTAAWCLFGIGSILILGWPVAIWANWEDIVSSESRLGYLISDILLVTPLCFAGWLGIIKGKSWGSLISLLAFGALAYDGLHFGIFLIQVKFLNIPAIIYLILIIIVMVVIYILSKNLILQSIKK